MENLLESNERTLVMFDSVCSGLSSCLTLVHTDIKQMTEHRNKLAQLEQEQLQAKLVAPRDLLNNNNNNNNTIQNKDSSKGKRNNNKSSNNKLTSDSKNDDDPHHLAGLKLLDKRLADSFSQAFSLNDLHKSSLMAKQQSNQNRPSIFQVLLGKSNKNNYDSSTKKDGLKNNNNNNSSQQENEQLDNRMIIDDINRQTRLAMQYSKQLEAHLFKVEDLRSKYEMHLKMGLVVKSVARAYLPTNNQNGSSLSGNVTPCTLARRHHCSSLVINDSSSSMGTHSSLSSLNLSTWSSSRSKANKQRRANEAATLQNNGQMFVSTISLSNNNNKHNNTRRLNLSKLISPSSKNNLQQQQQQQQHYNETTMDNTSKRRVSSQSMVHDHTPYMNKNTTYTYTDWALAPTPLAADPYGNYNNNTISSNDTLSKSNINLTASRTSLKGNKSSKNQAASSKTTIKEFIENIDRIEAEFESFMGSFLLAIEDIQGFARVCQGDVFEISIKYGDTQKFKTRISVLKDNRQKCDNSQTVFKARIADVLAIKAYECKGLGKRVLLGHKLCETRDLFTARSQLMTISLNQTGSIKLNLIITWNPLHLAPNSSAALPTADISHISLPPTPASSSTLSSLSSVPSLGNGVGGGTTTTINIKSQNANRTTTTNNNNKMPTQTSTPAMNDKQHLDHHHHQHESAMYQTVDPTYGYYIPPPDYLTNELKYRE